MFECFSSLFFVVKKSPKTGPPADVLNKTKELETEIIELRVRQLRLCLELSLA